jgi:hypothetical protein
MANISLAVPTYLVCAARFSFQKRYFDGFEKHYPFLTAIIHVQDGIVSDVTWDDAGIFCDPNSASPGTFDYSGFEVHSQEVGYPVRGCWFMGDLCRLWHSEGQTDCDLALNVVWTGTDSQGKILQSLDDLYKGGLVPVEKYSGATLTEASRVGLDLRGVVFSAVVPYNELTGEPLAFSNRRFADMNENDVAYLATVQRDGEGTLRLPERSSESDPESSDPAIERSGFVSIGPLGRALFILVAAFFSSNLS